MGTALTINLTDVMLTEEGMSPSFEDEVLETKWQMSRSWTRVVTCQTLQYSSVVFLDAVTTKCKIDGRLLTRQSLGILDIIFCS